MQGDRDRPPLPVGHPEASCHAAVQAAADAILALCEREQSGLGQHLDASMQAAIVWTLLFVTGHATLYGEDVAGYGAARGGPPAQLLPGVVIPNVARTKDGFVVMTLVLGEVGARGFGKLMRFAAERGGLEPDIAERDWSTWMQQLGAGKLAPADLARALAQIVAFLGTCTKAEIQERAVREAWLVGPAWSAADLLADRQLEARDYCVRVGDTLHPGAFAKLSRTPIQLERAAPRLGADQALADAPRSRPNVARGPGQRGRRGPPRGPQGRGLLLGGRGAARLEGPREPRRHGRARGVRQVRRPAPLRPAVEGRASRTPRTATRRRTSTNRSSGSRSTSRAPQGREVALRLVDWADVVIESFTPGTAQKLGLDWETLSKRKPGLVMLSSCLRGQTGPERAYTGFGLQGAGARGLLRDHGLARPPALGAVGGLHRLHRAALLARRARRRAPPPRAHRRGAVHRPLAGRGGDPLPRAARARLHRERTHRGPRRHAAPSAPARTASSARPATSATWRSRSRRARSGARSVGSCPASRPSQRRSGRRSPRASPRRSASRRRSPRGAASRSPSRAPSSCARPAFPPTSRSAPPISTPTRSSRARGFFVELDHPRVGKALYDGPVTLFSATPARITCAGPAVGHDTFEVMTRILGYGEDAVAELAAAGVLS